MKSWRPSRPSPAMIVALLALCVALGGSAVAARRVALAPKNTVNSAAVIDNSLRLRDFKRNDRAKLKGAKGDPGPAGTPDGYTKVEADGRFLGKADKAADADKLDGIDSSGFTHGDGAQSAGFRTLADGHGSGTLVSLPGIGDIGFSCGSTMSLSISVSNDISDAVQWEENDTGTLSSHVSPAGAGVVLNLGSTNHQIIAQFHRSHSPVLGIVDQNNATLVITIFRGATGDNATDCRVHAQVINSHAFSSIGLLR